MITQLTDQDLQVLEELLAKATPGPWHAPGLGELHDDQHRMLADFCHTYEDDEETLSEDSVPPAEHEINMEFIAALVNLAPQLIAAAKVGMETRTEPVAWRYKILCTFTDSDSRWLSLAQIDKPPECLQHREIEPLYASPPPAASMPTGEIDRNAIFDDLLPIVDKQYGGDPMDDALGRMNAVIDYFIAHPFAAPLPPPKG